MSPTTAALRQLGDIISANIEVIDGQLLRGESRVSEPERVDMFVAASRARPRRAWRQMSPKCAKPPFFFFFFSFFFSFFFLVVVVALCAAECFRDSCVDFI